MARDRPGIAFEKAVAALQARLDPAAHVSHNEILVDRHNHRRQFDVVFRGAFCGQKVLGVIECKDLKGRVGTPEVDAFCTKAADINANFKILMSRRGFTKQALEKSKHYGIQCLSLIERDPSNANFRVGTYWNGFLKSWSRLELSLQYELPLVDAILDAESVTISGKRVLDWYKNYLLDVGPSIEGQGWVAPVSIIFKLPQQVTIADGVVRSCTGVSFRAERVIDEREYFVGFECDGFFNWQESVATFPANTSIVTSVVPTDLRLWSPRTNRPTSDTRSSGAFIEVAAYASANQFERVEDALDLRKL